jgi:hypothetical protein
MLRSFFFSIRADFLNIIYRNFSLDGLSKLFLACLIASPSYVYDEVIHRTDLALVMFSALYVN